MDHRTFPVTVPHVLRRVKSKIQKTKQLTTFRHVFFMYNSRGKLLYYITSSRDVNLKTNFLIILLTHQEREISQIPKQQR